MELCAGQIGAVTVICDIDISEQLPCLLNTAAFSENKRDKLILSHIYLIIDRLSVNGTFYKIQPCHTKPLFVHSVIEKRIIKGRAAHSDNCVVARQSVHMPHFKCVISRHDHNGITVGKFIVKSSSEIKSVRSVSGCCTHIFSSKNNKTCVHHLKKIMHTLSNILCHNRLFFILIHSRLFPVPCKAVL